MENQKESWKLLKGEIISLGKERLSIAELEDLSIVKESNDTFKEELNMMVASLQEEKILTDDQPKVLQMTMKEKRGAA